MTPTTLRYCASCALTFTDGHPLPICCPRCEGFAPLLVPGPMFHIRPRAAAPWSVHPLAKLADFWMGIFFDEDKRRLYVLPLPCLGFWVQLPPVKNRRAGHGWRLLSTVLLCVTLAGWFPWVLFSDRMHLIPATLYFLAMLACNGGSLYAGRRARLASHRKEVPRHWTETTVLDAARETPPHWPVRMILAMFDALLRLFTPAGHCQGCARRLAMTTDAATGIHLCGLCADDLERLRARRREIKARHAVTPK